MAKHSINRKKRTCPQVDSADLVDHRGKVKTKYFNLAREQKKLWNRKVMVIPVVIGAFGMVPKCLEKRLEELKISKRVETIQTTVQLKSARILRRFMEETRGNLLSLRLQ